MLIIKPDEAKQVHCPNKGFISHRYLLESDDMGFTMTRTVIPKGDKQYWHYAHHLEACYCISGHGLLSFSTRTGPVTTHDVTDILPGVVYALDKNDPHHFQALEDTTLICVFNPPLKGNEVHNEEGHYDA